MSGVKEGRGVAKRVATPRTSIKDRISRRTMLLRRLRRWLQPVAWSVFALAVALFVFLTVHSVAPGSSIASLRERLGGWTGFTGMRIAHVTILGRENAPEPWVTAALGVEKGAPILGFSVEAARQRIVELPWVEDVTVERQLPDTIVVALHERQPFAIWQNQNQYVLIGRDGQIIAHEDVGRFKDRLPMVVGAGAASEAKALLTTLDKYPALRDRVVASVRVGERRWNLHMRNGADVLLPEGHETEALNRLMQLQQDHALLDRPLAAIDLRLPDRLTTRPQAEAASANQPPATDVLPMPPPPPPPPEVPAAKRPT
jgi:cell division protein FtsQ